MKCFRAACDGEAVEVKRLVTDESLHTYYRCKKCGLLFDAISTLDQESAHTLDQSR